MAARETIVLLIRFQSRLSPLASSSLDDLVRSRQHIGRNLETDLLRGLEVDDQLKLHRLLDWKIGGPGALENFIDVAGGSPEQIGEASAIRNEATSVHGLSIIEHRRQAVLYPKIAEPASLREK